MLYPEPFGALGGPRSQGPAAYSADTERTAPARLFLRVPEAGFAES